MKFFCFVLAFSLFLTPFMAHAVTPDEMLSNPVLEARAEKIDALLRCPVCQGETIADSSADLAHDIRLLVRQRILKGDSNQQAIDYIVDRYGNFVLMKPPFNRETLLLWGGPVLLLLIALLAARRFLKTAPLPAETLSDAEEARLSRLLKNDDERRGA